MKPKTKNPSQVSNAKRRGGSATVSQAIPNNDQEADTLENRRQPPERGRRSVLRSQAISKNDEALSKRNSQAAVEKRKLKGLRQQPKRIKRAATVSQAIPNDAAGTPDLTDTQTAASSAVTANSSIGNDILQTGSSSADAFPSSQDMLDNLHIVIESPSYMQGGFDLFLMDYKELTEEKYFTDKSDFILQVLASEAQILAFFRQRNCMKTTHLKAIDAYCDFNENRSKPNFGTMKAGINDRYYGQFCVIYVSFDSIEVDSKEAKSDDILKIIRRVILYYVKLYLTEHSISLCNAEETIRSMNDLEDIGFLSWICVMIHDLFSKKVLLLFDNIDVPFLNFNTGFTESAFKKLFNALSTKPPTSLEKIVMMGNIVPSYFFKRSSFPSYTRLDLGCNAGSFPPSYFMFTRDEVTLLCEKYSRPRDIVDELHRRFGGYYDYKGESTFFNPFSIVQFFKNEIPLIRDNVTILWSYFYSRDILHVSHDILISKAERYIWIRMLGFPDQTADVTVSSVIEYKKFQEDIVVGFLYLLYGGYLTQKTQADGKRTLRIPNKEVRAIFIERRKTFIADEACTGNFELWNDIFNKSNDYKDFCDSLNPTLAKCSSRTFKNELSYHVFLLMIFSCNKVFKFRDEPETGLGFADIVLIPVIDGRNPIVIEIAFVSENTEKKRNIALKNMFAVKLKQVKERLYGVSILEEYNKMDILILIGCCRKMYHKIIRNQIVPR